MRIADFAVGRWVALVWVGSGWDGLGRIGMGWRVLGWAVSGVKQLPIFFTGFGSAYPVLARLFIFVVVSSLVCFSLFVSQGDGAGRDMTEKRHTRLSAVINARKKHQNPTRHFALKAARFLPRLDSRASLSNDQKRVKEERASLACFVRGLRQPRSLLPPELGSGLGV